MSRIDRSQVFFAAIGIAFLALASVRVLADPAPRVGNTFWGVPCSNLGRGTEYGPYDYTQRASYMGNLKLVEEYHFGPQVERLLAGQNNVDPIGDIDYTLRAWPNHHRALNSVIRLRLRSGSNAVYYQKSGYGPAECYLQRAVNYSPKDAMVRMLFGILFHRMERYEEAMSQYQIAEKLQPKDLQIKYNLGLLMIDMEKLEEAAAYAAEVYQADFPLLGLQRKLSELRRQQ
jgi:tetratricopeptide (TPR) repeat protein